MPSGSWYFHRLRAMSAGEVWWRLTSAVRDRADALRLTTGTFPDDTVVPSDLCGLGDATLPRLVDLPLGAWHDVPPGSLEASWRDRLVARADRIARHQLTIFGHERNLGTPIEWNRDHETGVDTPRVFAPHIDYRDARSAGDAKIVWEPSRHQHLVVLARAYRATGDRRYAAAAVEQLTSWLDQCPFPHGMHWRSPLELAIRLINWTWTIDLMRDAAPFTTATARRVLHAIHLQLWDVTRKFSRGSSANNHLIGEAAGVFVASRYFPQLDRGGRWSSESFKILCREIHLQTNDDGGTREQAFGYQLFVLDLLLVAAITGRATGVEFPEAFWRRLEQMIDCVRVLTDGGPLPLFGDCDDGYAMDLGRIDDAASSLLCVGALLFARGDFTRSAATVREPAIWLLGTKAREGFDRLPAVPATLLESSSLSETGYYLLQYGMPGAPESVSVVFDCAPLGFTSIAAHGHADALSFVLRAFGREVLVDPGTYDYFSFPEWRAYFTGTRAHNTVMVDNVDQSESLGLFLWGSHARARCIDWRPTENGGAVTGEHDGYRRLADPVVHRRTLSLDGRARTLLVRDELIANGEHDASIAFHFAEDCDVVPVGDQWHITVGEHRIRLTVDAALRARAYRASENPRAGWVSRGYHRKTPSTSVIATSRVSGSTSFECRFTFEPQAGLA